VGITAAALVLGLSDIPWRGPLVGIAVGRVNGELVLNPTIKQMEQSDLNLIFSVSGDKIMMVDADAKETKEEDVFKAFEFGVKAAQPLLDFVKKVCQEAGKEKQDENVLIELANSSGEVKMEEKKAVFEEAKKFFASALDKYLFNQPKGTKRERKEIAKVLLKDFTSQLKEQGKHEEIIDYVSDNFEKYLEAEVTKAILEREQRVDGRKLTDIRPLDSEVSLLPRVHGSALFNRGETQVLSVVTLGAPGDAQILDEMTKDDTKKSYMHFYNCPPYSFGEAGPFRSPGRREIGHGALAEKALLPVLPKKEEFPYTIMVVSEVMGSNGSSSMASTCGSTLSLMDAGVPISKPVAGIAMGLASDGNNYKILTDLQDMEDGEGGMDFKVAGTKDGITAIQMDTKTSGLSLEICQKTLTQAKEARMAILDKMAQTIAQPRTELSVFAPRIVSFSIDPEHIRDVIGSGGKVINEIIDTCNVQIDIDDDGLVMVTGVNAESTEKAVKWVKDLSRDIEAGEIFTGKVTRLMDFGAFVEILPGREGLVHISEFSTNRVDNIRDVAEIGKELKVKVIEIDSQGRINLSVKKADLNYDPSSDARPSFERRERPRDNNRGRFNKR
ncbi:MAG: polyribonucleotide nucleotidyltransferase, partial [Patescibacteria group bacterium]